MGLAWAGVIIAFGAIAGLTTVLLVMMYGQTRVFYAMSRDGLIPPLFVTLHSAWRTPWISQIVFGILIAAAGAFFPISILGIAHEHGNARRIRARLDRGTDRCASAIPKCRERSRFPFGPYVIPTLSAVSALVLIYFLRVGNPLVWGFFPARMVGLLDLV